MKKQLTVQINERVIEKAEAYAKEHNTSLSKMIENYFDSLDGLDSETDKTTELVKSLVGVIDLKEDFEFKSERARSLLNKHQ